MGYQGGAASASFGGACCLVEHLRRCYSGSCAWWYGEGPRCHVEGVRGVCARRYDLAVFLGRGAS